MIAASTALALILAAAARAQVAVYDAGPLPPPDAVFSADGYHYAYLDSGPREDRWIVDGAARVSGPAGTLAGPGALSADGSILFHFLSVDGGLAPAINGVRVGKKVYAEIGPLLISPRGRNAAFVVRLPGGWAVVSGQGMGPAFPKQPRAMAVSEESVVYVEEWMGARWLYRDHRPERKVPYDDVSFSADLRRVGGRWQTPTRRFFVEIDGEKTGPWDGASTPAFSPGGRHAGYCAARGPNQYGRCAFTVVDGIERGMTPCMGCRIELDDAGRPFVDTVLVAVDARTVLHSFSLYGRPLGKGPSFGSGFGHYGFTRLGADMGGNGVVVDGRTVAHAAPMALSMMGPVFDGGREYHYWALNGKNLVLVCGALDGRDPAQTRCARRAEDPAWPRVRDLAPPSAPVSAP